MAILKVTKHEKQELEIATVFPAKPYGNGSNKLVKFSAHVLPVVATGDDKVQPLMFTIFNTVFQEYIKTHNRFVADYQERESDNKDYAPDRVIIQIYDDGKPVFITTSQSKVPWQKPSVPVAQDTRSMDGRAAMYEVGSYIRVIDEDSVLPECIKRCVEKYWKAVERSLDNFLDSPSLTRTQETPPNGAKASPTTTGGK